MKMETDLMGGIDKAIQTQLRENLHKILEEETKAAQERVRVRMKESIAGLAMKVSSWYEIRTQENRIVIEVKTDI